MLKTNAKVSAVSVKRVRENRGEGAIGDQRVVVFKMSAQHTPELLEMLGSNIDEPLNVTLSIDLNQRKLNEKKDTAQGELGNGEDGDERQKPKTNLRKGPGATAGN